LAADGCRNAGCARMMFTGFPTAGTNAPHFAVVRRVSFTVRRNAHRDFYLYRSAIWIKIG